MAKLPMSVSERLPRKEQDARVLYGTPVGEPPMVGRVSRTVVAFAALAWIATLAVSYLLGRASVPSAPVLQSSAAPVAPARAVVLTAQATPARTVAASPQATPTPAADYPRYTTTVPAAFRGAWDEIVADKCIGREARYVIGASTFSNFEVHADVERVKLVSASQIELKVTGYDEDKNQFDSTIGFRLLDGGKVMAGTDAGSNMYRKCPS